VKNRTFLFDGNANSGIIPLMSERLQYPIGIEYREPRPRGALGGALLGALFGYGLAQNSGGAIAGGAIGGALGNQSLPLNEALRQKFAEKNLGIISFYRLGTHAAKILFRHNKAYWTLESRTPESPEMNLEQIEDWLYGDLVQKLDDFLSQNDLRLQP